jgi:hypothetical protein
LNYLLKRCLEHGILSTEKAEKICGVNNGNSKKKLKTSEILTKIKNEQNTTTKNIKKEIKDEAKVVIKNEKKVNNKRKKNIIEEDIADTGLFYLFLFIIYIFYLLYLFNIIIYIFFILVCFKLTIKPFMYLRIVF